MYPYPKTRYRLKLGDNWAETIIIEAEDENGDATLLTIPTRASLHICASALGGTPLATLDSDAGEEPDGAIAIAQVGNTVQISWSLPAAKVIAATFAPETTYYADLQLIGSPDLPSPCTVCEIEIDTYYDRTEVSA